MVEPDIKRIHEEIHRGNETLAKHTAHDEEIDKIASGERAALKLDVSLLKEQMKTLATKDDIEELKEFMKNVNIGLGIFRFSWNNASKIGFFVLFIVGLFMFFKAGILAFVGFVFNK